MYFIDISRIIYIHWLTFPFIGSYFQLNTVSKG
jgi:hypothetical protein